MQETISLVFLIKQFPMNIRSILDDYGAMGVFFRLSETHSCDPRATLHTLSHTLRDLEQSLLPPRKGG